MKKLYVVLLVLLVVTILTCDNNSKQITCTCAETEHDAECTCGADICNCTVRVPQPKECECEVKDHLGIDETCLPADGCTVEAPNNCDCTLKVYGSFVDLGGNTVNIYRKGEVQDMNSAVQKVKDAYNSDWSVESVDKSKLNGKIRAIYIIPGTDRNRNEVDGGFIIELGEGRTSDSMRLYLQATTDLVARAVPAKSNGIFLATAFSGQFTIYQKYAILHLNGT